MTEVILRMSPVIIVLFVLSQTVSVKNFTCKNKSDLCSPENCAQENEMDCMKTCKVCTDEGCSEGYYYGDDHTCYSCSAKESKISQSYKEKCNIFCLNNKTHGKHCEKNCSDSCLNRRCLRWTGDCERCPSGFYGPRCQQRSRCNNIDEKGFCIGACFSGFFGPKCEEECPLRCIDEVCNKQTGECVQCVEGFWGKFCQLRCSNNCLTNSCSKNGQCSQVCKDGFFGMNCSKKCSANCLHRVCNRKNGSCTDGCVSGKYYGDRCDKACPYRCLNSTCDRKTGNCKNGCYGPVTYGTFCNYSCSSGCRSVRCGNISDYVVCRAVCDSGRKGEHCSDFCPRNCKGSCNQLSGRCLHGCLSGFHGIYCNKSCLRNCKGSCDQLSGRCLHGCISGYHGIYCNNSCPANCLGSVCHQTNRTCVDGCVTSFYGPTCSNRCSDNCAVCDANDNCILSSYGRHNELNFSTYGVWLTVIFGVIIFSILLSISLAVCFSSRKMKKKSRKKQQRAQRRMEGLTRYRVNEIPHVQPDPTNRFRRIGNTSPPSAADHDILIDFFQSQTTDENDDDNESHRYEYIDDCMILSRENSTGMFSNVPQIEAEECKIENEIFCEIPYYQRLPSNDANNTDDAVPFLYCEQDESVDIKQFDTYVYNMNLMKGFHQEFQFLQKIGLYSTDIADKLENVPKNRYSNTKPYDYNRVTLELIPEIPASDYINASFINGYHKSRSYIAAQGPTENTATDFWRMVWEVNSTHIIMLTNLVENDESKCSLYWPESETKSKTYEDLMIELKHLELHPTYTSRIFNLSKTSNPELTRTVTQLHYEDWMDKQMPNNARALLDFILYVRGLRDRGNDHPLLVHCSDGVGRTGTFIAIDYLLDQALSRGRLDVVGCVARLRKQRTQMVQNFMQYNLIHQLLLEWLLSFNIISETGDVIETDCQQKEIKTE